MKSLSKVPFIPAVAFIFAVLVHTSLFADDSFKAFLVDIPEWQGEQVQAMNMEMDGVKMINAVRSYEKGDTTFDATVMVTTLQMGVAPFQQMNMSAGGVKIQTTRINDFKCMHTHDSNENSGSIMVLLGKTDTSSALFTLTYEGLSEEGSVALAKKFDWKGMQKTAKALMQ